MKTLSLRHGFASLAPLFALLAVLGCGGGGGSSSSCSTLCKDAEACATKLDATLAVLIGDDTITNANCVTTCDNELASCSNKSAFLGCAEGLACTSVAQYQTGFNGCASSNCR